MAHTNIVFGNETEADAFGKAMGYDTDNRIGKQQKNILLNSFNKIS